MLQSIINFSIRNKLIILLGTIFLFAYGCYEITKLPIDAVPDITDNQVQVITVSPALGAPDVERFISFPIEQINSNLPGLKEIRSFSRFGLSVVTIVFQDGIDVYWARQQVAERLQQVQNEIPEGLGTPFMGPVTTGLGEIYQYVLRTKKGYENKYSSTELRTLQDWIVRRQLLGVQGIADVSSFGGLLKQYQIVVNTDRLKSLHLSINDVFIALQNNNQNTGGAYIEKGPTVLFIRSEGLINKLEDIENIVITTNEEAMPIKISDIARVEIGAANRYGAVCFNDEGETVGAVVMMLKGENSSAVIKNVKAKIETIQKMLPEGVIIEPFLDRTKMVNNAISTVESNLMEGALIVIFILVLFLGNIRAGLVVASVIPLSMLFAIIMMNLFHVSGNLMSLGAIDFGLIIDGAVIIVEAVMHVLYHQSHSKELFLENNISSPSFEGAREENKTSFSQSEMDTQVSQSAGKMMNVAIFGQIIILIVYLPIFTLQGIEGKMFKPMAQTVTFALLGAFLLSLTYVPVITALFLSKKIKHKASLSDKMMERIENIYQRTLQKVIRFPKLVLTAAVLLFCFAMYIMTTLGGEFIPELEEGDFAVETRVLTGTNLPTTIEHTQKAVHLLLTKFPEITKIVTKIGSGEIPTDPMPIEAADMMIILKDRKEWTSAETFDELAEKMSTALEDIPGVTFGFQYPVQMRFNELMTGARQDIVCKIFGENLDTLSAKAHQLGELIPSIEGAKDLYIETVTGMPQIVITYNRNMIAQYGLNISDINKIVNTAFAGASAGLVFEGEKRFELVVKLEATQRKSIEDVQNLQISTPNGMQIPLSHVASVQIVEGPAQIQRENAQRRITVGFNARGRDVQSIVEELQQKVEKKLTLPSGYFMQYGGSFENLQAAKERLSIAVPVSLLLIFLMLYFAFTSVKQGLLIYTAIPLSAIGGILALATRGMAFSISAGIGFIALFGVAVLNGIVLLSEFNQLQSSGMTDLKEIILVGTKKRLRPVLMTAAVASLGFIPMALSHGAGGEVQRPLATVVIGGLFTATLLTLFVLPILYMLFQKTPKGSIITTLLLLVLPYSTFAQKEISLTSAIDSAIKHHPSTLLYETSLSQSKALYPTYKEINPTSFDLNLGQFNSLYIDYKVGVNQTLLHPKNYQVKKELLKVKSQSVVHQQRLSRHQVANEVAQLYIKLLSLQTKDLHLQKLDSIYQNLLSLSKIRLEQGEDNSLQYEMLKVEDENLLLQLLELQAEEENLLLQLQKLLGVKEIYAPVSPPTPPKGGGIISPPLGEAGGGKISLPPLLVKQEGDSILNHQKGNNSHVPPPTPPKGGEMISPPLGGAGGGKISLPPLLVKQEGESILNHQKGNNSHVPPPASPKGGDTLPPPTPPRWEGVIFLPPLWGGQGGEQHPLLQYENSLIEIAKAETEMEKLRKLPSFSVGINLQSLTGFQNINGNERYYATYPRFAYVQAGINIPIYQKANDAYIKAAKLNEKITTEKVELLQFQLEQSYQIYEQEVKKYEKLVLYYENKLFPQRLKLLQLANQEYLGGELSFVEWLNVIQQYQNISLQYIETQQQLYKAQAALYYFVKYE